MHNKNTQLLFHLSLINRVGPGTLLRLLSSVYHDFYQDREHISWMDIIQRHADLPLGVLYDYTVSDLVAKAGLSEKIATEVFSGLSDKLLLENELQLVDRYGVHVISVFDSDYPELLKQINAPPPVLYLRGAALHSTSKRIGIVGARKSGEYARRVVARIVPGLVENGWHIVSGGAEGADTMAHEATLDVHGSTVVVMGSGFSYTYPTSNKKLFERVVASGGTIISPFSVATPPDRGNFPARNRILSGLSLGCLIVQAAEKSGSLITGNYALEQGRQVFAVPGLIDDELSSGCHNLIKQGAKLVHGVNDILEEFGEAYVGTVLPAKTVSMVLTKQPHPADPFLALLGEPATIDELCERSGMTMGALQNHLFSLQLEGRVQQNFVGMWELVEGK